MDKLETAQSICQYVDLRTNFCRFPSYKMGQNLSEKNKPSHAQIVIRLGIMRLCCEDCKKFKGNPQAIAENQRGCDRFKD